MVLTLKLILIFGLQKLQIASKVLQIDLTAALNAKINEKFVASLQE